MKIMQMAVLPIIVLFFGLTGQSQDFEVPENTSFTSATDYKNAENDVIKAINWIENTPLNVQENKRKATIAYLMKWMTGTPHVSIEVMPYVVNLTKVNPELLMIFLNGWTKYVLENNDGRDDKLGPNVAGIRSLIRVYVSNKDTGIKKVRQIEILLRMDEEQLEGWVRNNI